MESPACVNILGTPRAGVGHVDHGWALVHLGVHIPLNPRQRPSKFACNWLISGRTVSEYFNKVKVPTDTMALVGSPLAKEDVVSDMLCVLGSNYNPHVVIDHNSKRAGVTS